MVADPGEGLYKVNKTLDLAIRGGADVIQIWNHWQPGEDKISFVKETCALAHSHNVPVLINDDWHLMMETPIDGVHFDQLPEALHEIRKRVGRPFLCGITCGNDLNKVQWANDNQLDYISFCSMFPSASAGACEIVTKETVMKARQITSLPIFLAGGISINNLSILSDTGLNGIALISAIMHATDPLEATQTFKEKLNELKIIKHEVVSNG